MPPFKFMQRNTICGAYRSIYRLRHLVRRMNRTARVLRSRFDKDWTRRNQPGNIRHLAYLADTLGMMADAVTHPRGLRERGKEPAQHSRLHALVQRGVNHTEPATPGQPRASDSLPVNLRQAAKIVNAAHQIIDSISREVVAE